MSILKAQALDRATRCEIRLDALTRTLYSTDASIYQVEPYGVAFPRSADELSELVQAAAAESLPLVPRGAGTGLAGGALGRGLIVDVARHNRGISGLNVEARTVRVGAGVVLDQLNAALKPHGLTFGPDVATSSRATLGGMIGNNSSGARTPIYGTTIDHVRSLEVVLADGRIVHLGNGDGDGLRVERAEIERVVRPHEELIRQRLHDGIIKRWPGYGLDRYLRSGGDLTRLVGGSEGTLAAVFSAELNLTPLPTEKGVGLIFFASVAEAMQATVELLDLRPAAIEHIDDVLFEQTRGQRQFASARELLDLDAAPCTSILIVEFYEDVEERLAALMRKNLGLRKYRCRDEREMGIVWNLRKAGLSLLTGCKGSSKPTAGVEDVAVPPEKLPEYVAGLQSLMAPLGLSASFYGHAASGLLHVRPVVDLHRPEDVVKFRMVGEGVAALTRQFKGALAAEHGVGIARTEFLAEQLGPELLEVMRRIKGVFDPRGLMNPGKILDDGSYRFDTNLRVEADGALKLPFTPRLAFQAKDESFLGNLEQCNGCGGCRKAEPTMCPTFVATGEDLMATRGRANVIRAALARRIDLDFDPLAGLALAEALGTCLACKACTTECPSNVNMALLKAELLHAKNRKFGVSWSTMLISRIDVLSEIASRAPGLANALMRAPFVASFNEWFLGLSAKRSLPPYAAQRFDAWFRKRPGRTGSAPRGEVILWDDCFVRHNEPHIGRAAVRVLESAGFEVTLPAGRACCGRPAFSGGRLDVAAYFGRRNLTLLSRTAAPVVFLEPSCHSMFVEDYKELGLPGAREGAERSVLFEDFMERLLAREPHALRFREGAKRVAIHSHCHAKALGDAGAAARLAARIPGAEVNALKTGCCGMAGAFGQLASKYDLSLKVAEPLVALLNAEPSDACVVASGTSCRHQIEHLTPRRPKHMAEVLADALDDSAR